MGAIHFLAGFALGAVSATLALVALAHHAPCQDADCPCIHGGA